MRNNIKALIHKCKKLALDIFAPRKCVGCGKRDESFCPQCLHDSFKYGAGCVFCNFRNNTGKICKLCQKQYFAPIFQILWTGKYEHVVKNAIKELKYWHRLELADPLAELLHKKFYEFYPKYEKEGFSVIPIPMHPKKEYVRGFNQAELIAKKFSKLSGITISTNLLQKTTDTKTQVETRKKEERIRNLENTFKIDSKSLMTCGAQRKTIILIDDVTTTGATFMHASRTLQKSGFTKIICLAIAHGYG